ncbi:MAG: hypothetical protein U0031_09600 [Thermomicrobiales bacterium]
MAGVRSRESGVRRTTILFLVDSPSRRLFFSPARLALAICLFALLTAPLQRVRAGIELGQAGNTGGHGLTDSRESPGATCRFEVPLAWSLGETWLQVRPPVMFARDSTDRVDEQVVGWRAVIARWDRASGAWAPLVEGETQRTIAAENRAAVFDSRGPETQFFLGYGPYLVTLELFWYERMTGDGEPRLAGKVTYQIEHYAIAVRDRGETRPIGVASACSLAS